MHIHESQLNSLFLLMASSIFSLASQILLLILFHLLFETDHTCSASNAIQKSPTGYRFTLTRVHFGNKIPQNQHTLNSFREAKSSPLSSIASQLKTHKDEYVMELTSGNPPVKFSAIMDTGSDLIWTKCQDTTPRSSSLSSSSEDCDTIHLPASNASCIQKYADGTSVKVTMVKDSLTIGEAKIPNITFGCGTPSSEDNKYDGVVGLGRGELSLLSQLNEKIFSYCLASSLDKSILLTGFKATNSMSNTNFQSTPLLKQGDKSYYYINLEGISVGETKLPIDKSNFAIETDGTGGMIIDSGTTFTYLEKGIIKMIENEFTKQTKLKMFNDEEDLPYNGLDRCFNSTYDVKIIPKLVFHFKGANWDLPKENYIYNTKKGKACLGFIDIDKEDTQKVAIFGNMQQQNMMVLYNLDKKSLSFKPANCNQF